MWVKIQNFAHKRSYYDVSSADFGESKKGTCNPTLPAPLTKPKGETLLKPQGEPTKVDQHLPSHASVTKDENMANSRPLSTSQNATTYHMRQTM